MRRYLRFYLAFQLDKKISNCNRFIGLEKCFNICNLNEAEGYLKTHLIDTLSNPDEYMNIRNNLVKSCAEFTGFDINKPFFPDDYNPLISMANLLAEESGSIELLGPQLSSQKSLISAFLSRIILRKDPRGNGYDL